MNAAGQADSGMRMSFRAWEEQSWLQLLDRDGAAGGRISERGVLQRWDSRIDNRYHLDLIYAAFPPRDEAVWYASPNGARWSGGSINKSTLATVAEFKVEVPISGSWTTGLRFNQVNNAEGNWTAMRVSVSRSLSSGVALFVAGHLDTRKEDSDLELGARWVQPGPRGARAALSVAALDIVNNLIYLTFDAATQPGRDSTLEYLDWPLAVRGSVELPLGRALRAEAWGTVQVPATVLQYDSLDRSAGLRQQERVGYAGAALHWAATPRLALAAWATGIQARTSRDPISPGAPVAGYALREQTTQIGIDASGRLGTRWRLELGARQAWYPEQRDWTDSATADIDFLFQMSSAQATLSYAARSGFTLDGGIGWSRGSTPRGTGEIADLGNLEQHWLRFRYDVGLVKAPRARLLLGAAMDYDMREGIPTRLTFGGARARMMLLW